MKKMTSETVQTWIGKVKALACKLEEAGIEISEQDIILALLMSLTTSDEDMPVAAVTMTSSRDQCSLKQERYFFRYHLLLV
jgi:hypothetical protein